MKSHHAWRWASAGVVAALAATAGGSTETVRVPEGAQVKDYQTVACLLPARVRKLGNLAYPERRRLIKTTAGKCELRGGEYTYYDRAAPEGSVAFFKPLAEAGDPVAQVNLGEVYEYLFDEPRYAEAAVWYQKAADQGDATGLRRLAHLYEDGLGVKSDAMLATNLWRKAIGTDEDLVLASELDRAQTAADKRIAEVTEQLRTRNAEAEELRRALAGAQSDVTKRRNELDAARTQVASLQSEIATLGKSGTADPARVAALESELAERQRQIDEQGYRIASMEADIGAQNAQLTASVKQAELENQRLQAELARVSKSSDEQLASAREALDAKSEEVTRLLAEQTQLETALNAQQSRFDALREELDSTRATTTTSGAEAAAAVAKLEAERERQAAALAASQQSVTALKTRLASTQGEVAKLKTALDTAAHERQRIDAELASSDAKLLASKRSLDAADAELTQLRSSLQRAQTERDQLAASLKTAGAGGTAVAALQKQIQDRDRSIALVEGRLQAVTEQRDKVEGELERMREQRNMQLATRGVVDPLPDTSKVTLPRGVKVGKGYALVIGNNNYQSDAWRDLNFARSDAERVHEVLERGYGFESTLVLDATATQMYAAFNQLGEKLQAEDRLVVYYAGHGIQVKGESAWVGIDAPDRKTLKTTSVSSGDFNRWLDAQPAKHIIVISDSCYAGEGVETSGGMMYTATDVSRILKFNLGGRSRTLIASGGDEPVPDGDAGEGSLFTKVLVSLLNENRGVLFADDLFEHLKQRVRYGIGEASAEVRTPVFARLEEGGHGSGQFVFMRPNIVQSVAAL